MILRVEKDYVKKIDSIIAEMTKQKSFKDKDTLLSRIIWNYFTDTNSERKRSEKLINLYLERDINISDVIGKK